MYLDWKSKNGGWFARSSDGAEARVYPHPAGEGDCYVVEADLGGEIYKGGVDASKPIDCSQNPTRTRQRIVDVLKDSAEGYIIRFETLGIRDQVRADTVIRRMNPLEWHRRINGWWAKNSSDPGTGALALASNHPAASDRAACSDVEVSYRREPHQFPRQTVRDEPVGALA